MIQIKLLILSLLLLSFDIIAGEEINVFDIPPFYNFQKAFPLGAGIVDHTIINPIAITKRFYPSAKKISVDEKIRMTALKGETLYKSIVIENIAEPVTLKSEFVFDKASIFNEDNTEASLVVPWFQAGLRTTFTKKEKYLTQELLLKTDIQVDLTDKWVFEEGKWFYVPPTLRRSEDISTYIAAKDTRRILLEINIPKDTPADNYSLSLAISSESGLIRNLMFDIAVADITLQTALKDNYKLLIYNRLALDKKVGRQNSYINGQQRLGNAEHQQDIYRQSIKDIVDKGFNAVFVMDWRLDYVEDVLEITKGAGVKNLVFYGKSFIQKGKKVLRPKLVKLIREFGYDPIFYGYDEPGGNTKLAEQLAFNEEIHDLGAKSFNAIFWKDLQSTNKAIKNVNQKFDFLSVSMGSNGNKKFLKSLPIHSSDQSLRYLAYWHPHVENPTRNKLFMGYWLWASGLDGVSPHAYLLLPHIARFNKSDIGSKRGPLSPYNDFNMWDKPGGMFRQHATVYPAANGNISTLQWEAVADGVTDLILVQQLQQLLKENNNAELQDKASTLLTEIRKNSLMIKTTAVSQRDTDNYLNLMMRWKTSLKELLVEYSA